jgi:hypothetical protein
VEKLGNLYNMSYTAYQEGSRTRNNEKRKRRSAQGEKEDI